MVMYCRKCGKKIAGTKGHAVGKAIAGGLLFGPVGAVVGGAHGLAKEGHGEGLCVNCRLYEAEMRLIEAKDKRMKAEMRLREATDNTKYNTLGGYKAEEKSLKKTDHKHVWKYRVDEGFGSANIKITIDYDKCTGTGECVTACPSKIFEVVDGKAVCKVGECINCRACGIVCRRDAIEYSSD